MVIEEKTGSKKTISLDENDLEKLEAARDALKAQLSHDGEASAMSLIAQGYGSDSQEEGELEEEKEEPKVVCIPDDDEEEEDDDDVQIIDVQEAPSNTKTVMKERKFRETPPKSSKSVDRRVKDSRRRERDGERERPDGRYRDKSSRDKTKGDNSPRHRNHSVSRSPPRDPGGNSRNSQDARERERRKVRERPPSRTELDSRSYRHHSQ